MGVRYCPPLPAHHQRRKRIAERIRFTLLALTTIGVLNAAFPAQADGAFVDLPQDLEIELALSALPGDLQAEATVYVRDAKQGFIVHKQGTNGWATFVARTSVRFYEAPWEYAYPPDQLIPQAHDEIGIRNHARPYFDLERMRIDNVSAEDAKHLLRRRFADETYKTPRKAGLSYMLAPIHRAYMEPAKSNLVMTVSIPHHMPYAPHMSAKKLGTMDPHGRSGILGHGGHDSGPHGYMYFTVQPDQAKAIRNKYAALLKRLCEHHANWCLAK